MGLLGSFLNALFDPSRESRNSLRGAVGEGQGSLAMFLFLPGEYTVLSNVTVPTPRGTTQIDHVVVSQYGIHVIEAKNLKGAIYGAPDQRHWTVFLGPKKYQMLNPLIQNHAHILALAALLHLPESTFHSMVFFWSDHCRFKTAMPENVRMGQFCSFIRSKTDILIPHRDVPRILAAIQSGRLSETSATETAHVAQLNERFHTQHQSGDPCPRCPGGRLIERRAKATCQTFLGCSNYPRCRHTEKA